METFRDSLNGLRIATLHSLGPRASRLRSHRFPSPSMLITPLMRVASLCSSFARWPALVGGMSLGAGCAMSPGTTFDDAIQKDSRASANAMGATADAAPAGALQEITADLVRQLRAT